MLSYNCNDCIHNYCQLCVGCKEVYPPRNYMHKLVFKEKYKLLELAVNDLSTFINIMRMTCQAELQNKSECSLYVTTSDVNKMENILCYVNKLVS